MAKIDELGRDFSTPWAGVAKAGEVLDAAVSEAGALGAAKKHIEANAFVNKMTAVTVDGNVLPSAFGNQSMDAIDDEEKAAYLRTSEFSDLERTNLMSKTTKGDFYREVSLLRQSNMNARTLGKEWEKSGYAAATVGFMMSPLEWLPWMKVAGGARFSVRMALGMGAITAVEETFHHGANPNASVAASIMAVGGASAIGGLIGRHFDKKIALEEEWNAMVEYSLGRGRELADPKVYKAEMDTISRELHKAMKERDFVKLRMDARMAQYGPLDEETVNSVNEFKKLSAEIKQLRATRKRTESVRDLAKKYDNDDKKVLPANIFEDVDGRIAPTGVGMEYIAAETAPVARLGLSARRAIRSFSAGLLDNPMKIIDNLKGVPSPSNNLEALIKDEWRSFNDFMENADNAWVKYATDGEAGSEAGFVGRRLEQAKQLKDFAQGKDGAGKMSYEDFMEAVTMWQAGALKWAPAEVIEVASKLDEFYQKWGKRGSKFWLGEDASSRGASSKFLKRRYNIDNILSRPGEFKSFLMNQWRKNNLDISPGAEKRMADSIDETIEKMKGTPTDRFVPEDIFTHERGSLKERYWDFVDDGELYQTPWVLKDAAANMSAYTKETVADILFAERYGTLNVDDVVATIRKEVMDEVGGVDAYNQLSKPVRDQAESDIALAKAMMERVRGTYVHPWSPKPGGVVSRTIQSLMRFNNLRIGGGFATASFADVGRPVMAMGIIRAYGPQLKALVTADTEAFKAMGQASRDLKAWNVGNELYYSQRLSALTDDKPVSGSASAFERGLAKLNNDFFIINGLTPWNIWMKRTTGISVVNRIAESAKKANLGKQIDSSELSSLAQMGLGVDDLKEIGKELAEHGMDVKGITLTDYSKWKNQKVSKKLQLAVQKEVDTVITSPGVGDTPLLLDNAYVAMIAQYKTFALAAVTRMSTRGLQEGNANFYSGLLVAVLAGMAVTQYRDFMNDRGRPWDELVIEGINKSGILSSVGEANSLIQQTPMGTVAIGASGRDYGWDSYGLGPTASGARDLLTVASGGASGEWGALEDRARTRLSPYHNLFYIDALSKALDSGEDLEKDPLDIWSPRN